MRTMLCAGLAGLVLLLPRNVAANPDAPVLSDGRSAAMGGVGVATNDYASAVHQNPAGLSAVETFSGTAALTPGFVALEAPFRGRMGQTATVESDYQVAPLGMLAAGYRVHERVAVGLSVSMFNGAGANYQGAIAGQDVLFRAGGGELQLPVAVTITDALSVGIAYRVSFATVDVEAPMMTPAPGMQLARTETSLSGWNFLGFALGARYRVSDAFRIGVSYRNRVDVDMDGEVDVAGAPRSMDVDDVYALPHTFKIGTELTLLDNKLTMALDGTAWLYRDSHGSDDQAGGAVAWNNSFGGNLGLEYAATNMVDVRAGTAVFNSATSAAAASPFGVPPGILYVASAGVGVTMGDFVLDAAFAYMTSSNGNVSASENSQFPGAYGGNMMFGSLSLSYLM